MSEFHSAYSINDGEFLPGYINRQNGRELVRELIRDLVSQEIEASTDFERLGTILPEWAAAHPIALLENEFRIEIRQHDDPVSIEENRS